ncbi:MAG TPA: MlaD family protein [Candidatus Methylomirabilis sp.]|nr:MlaD family protein [Candidatus Methylomirabilis sp.]
MESRVNRGLVGLFVLVLSAGGIAALLWIGSGQSSRKAYDTYVTYFSESVAGLDIRAPVKLRGVQVGAVQKITIDPEDPARVRVVLSIERGTPVKEDTFAVLQTQGLTGIGFVELDGGSRSAEALRARPGEAFPAIETRPSLLARVDLAAASLAGGLDRVTTSLNETLDPETRQAFRSSAADLARILHTLAQRSRDLDAATVAAAEMARNGARASAALPELVERVGRTADAVERMGNEFAETAITARAAVQEARGTIGQVGEGVGRFNAEVVPDVRRLVADLRDASASLGRVTAELERDPGALVSGRPQPAPGPGE